MTEISADDLLFYCFVAFCVLCYTVASIANSFAQRPRRDRVIKKFYRYDPPMWSSQTKYEPSSETSDENDDGPSDPTYSPAS